MSRVILPQRSPVPGICWGIVFFVLGIAWAVVSLLDRDGAALLGVMAAILGMLLLYWGLKDLAVRGGCDGPGIPVYDSPFESERPEFCTSCGGGLKQEFQFCPRCGKKV